MTDNKLVIKINYDKKPANLNAQPQVVTVWHIRRIVMAALAIVLMAAVLVSWLGSDDQVGDTLINPVETPPDVNKSVPAIVEQPVMAPLEQAAHKEQVIAEAVKKTDTVKRPAAVIWDRRVIRASLNGKPKDNEPGEPIKSPLGIRPNQPLELFYFSEIRNMKGKAVFHRWLRNGQIVLQKQLDIKERIAKVWSSKLLVAKDKGEWQVQLADKKGRVYSEVNFVVTTE